MLSFTCSINYFELQKKFFYLFQCQGTRSSQLALGVLKFQHRNWMRPSGWVWSGHETSHAQIQKGVCFDIDTIYGFDCCVKKIMLQGRREVSRAAALQQYTLQGVRETGVELGRGSYAAVYTVEYKGLTCAAKIFHPTLYHQEYAIGRFQEECALLSRLKHPNIVQFLGVYEKGSEVVLPALVMECLDQYGVLPNEIGYSILKDVALALSYLHQHDPPIIHRDLSANNVLLTRGMTAKISDLGMAKHLFPTSLNQTLTETPGNANYMPPETKVANPCYDTKVDVFSYGVLMIHLFTAQWPFRTNHKVDPQDSSSDSQ